MEKREKLSHINQMDGGKVVSKETAVLCRWEVKSSVCFINRVYG